jgi:hypothetical protein
MLSQKHSREHQGQIVFVGFSSFLRAVADRFKNIGHICELIFQLCFAANSSAFLGQFFLL